MQIWEQQGNEENLNRSHPRIVSDEKSIKIKTTITILRNIHGLFFVFVDLSEF